MSIDNLPTNKNFQRFRKYYTAIEPSWQKPKNRIYTAIIFSFLAVSLFGWYAIRPVGQRIISLRQEIQDKKLINIQMEQKITDLVAARANLDQVSSQLYLIDEAIPNNSEPLDSALQLRNLINSSEATISSLSITSVPLVNPDKTGTIKNKDVFNISMILTGGYQSLENVISAINKMRRITTIETISLSQAKNEEAQRSNVANPIKLSLQVNTYYK